MRIRNIELVNFRCYEHSSFEFDDRLSVVVGNNTAGKTALLQAVLVSLGAYLQSLHSLPTDQSYRRPFKSDDVLRRYNPAKKDYFENENETGTGQHRGTI